MRQSERARETLSIADAPMVSEFRVGLVTRSGLGSLSLQDRQGLSGHSLRLCLSSRYGDVSLAIDIRDGNTSPLATAGDSSLHLTFFWVGKSSETVISSKVLALSSEFMPDALSCQV